MIYVSHCFGGKSENIEKVKNIMHDLQINDLDNTYICPLTALSHLEYNELGYEQEMLLCEDILTVCDKLIVASEISAGVKREIELASKIGMEVEFIEH